MAQNSFMHMVVTILSILHSHCSVIRESGFNFENKLFMKGINEALDDINNNQTDDLRKHVIGLRFDLETGEIGELSKDELKEKLQRIRVNHETDKLEMPLKPDGYISGYRCIRIPAPIIIITISFIVGILGCKMYRSANPQKRMVFVVTFSKKPEEENDQSNQIPAKQPV